MTQPGVQPPNATVCLCLPGMTLSGSIFPSLPNAARIDLDFNRLVLSADGSLPDGNPGMSAHAAILRNALADDERWRSAERRIAIAHSFGGMLLLHWLCVESTESPPPLAGMILIATTAGPMYDVVRPRLAQIGSLTLRIPFTPFLAFWNHPIVTRLAKRAFTGGRLDVIPVNFQDLRRRSDRAVDAAGWRNTDWRAMRSYRLAMRGFDVRESLHRLDIPAIVLHGTRDSLFPIDVGRALASALPNARFRAVDGGGHALPLTHGNAVRDAYRDLAG